MIFEVLDVSWHGLSGLFLGQFGILNLVAILGIVISLGFLCFKHLDLLVFDLCTF